ncbi:MAG: hypothetical protein ABR928_04300 [Terracidiphilus sp.]
MRRAVFIAMLLALVANLAPPLCCASCSLSQSERAHSCCVSSQTNLRAQCCSHSLAAIAETPVSTISRVPAAGAQSAILTAPFKTGAVLVIASRSVADGRSQPQIVLRA